MDWNSVLTGLFALLGIVLGACLERWRDGWRDKQERRSAQIERLRALTVDLGDLSVRMVIASAEVVRVSDRREDRAFVDAVHRAMTIWEETSRLFLAAAGELPTSHPGEEVILNAISALEKELESIHEGSIHPADRDAVRQRLTAEFARVVGILGTMRRGLEGDGGL